ncbi:MAG: radical SAM family heme chaperone HemW [Cyanobacteria bacterium P01_A01_bin.116]
MATPTPKVSQKVPQKAPQKVPQMAAQAVDQPVAQAAAAAQTVALKTAQATAPTIARSAYIHIPFCRRRCYYCDFAISVVGDRKRGDTSPTIETYVESLIREIRATPTPESPTPLQTVFFGGGTPSLLAVSQLEAIVQAIDERFGIAPTAEVSMEMDPATFELAHIQGYKAAGINRVSLGAQDFDDDVLAASGRFHRCGHIFHAIELLHQAGIGNFSLDLMSGLPHQTLNSWQASLEQVVAIQPSHLSQYDLIVEPQTAFSRYFTLGESPLPTESQTAEMYRMAANILGQHGYSHYEICNYAKAGYEAQHNLTYWRNQPCYGFGMGATSYLWHDTGYQRIDRPRTQATYQQWVAQFIAQGGQTQDALLSPAERVAEGIMVGLRLQAGISLAEVHQVHGERGLAQLERAIAPHIDNQWVVVENALSANSNVKKLEPTSRLRLSDPEGFLMSNVVIVDSFNALDADDCA